MLRTILLLLITLIALPFVAFYYDEPLAPEHWAALQSLVKIMLGVALTCFIVSELTGNCSQVDKLWSIVPMVYVWYIAVQSWQPWQIVTQNVTYSGRVVWMAILVSIWGLRLTFNFWRRGGYHWIPWRGEEDYRWSVLRQNPLLGGRFRWALFNLFFISLYQNTLILLFTLPIVVAWQGETTPMNFLDYLASALFLGFVVLETVADQQQWNFQKEKHRRMAAREPLGGAFERGFCASGLWAKVRHPNYAGEQAIWLSFYLFSVAATGRWLNWSLAGAILLMLLFLGSSDFSEKISMGKYSAYADYQRRVGRFLPKWFNK
jgi:steroid 5-alpha reductase family enzyme